MPVPSNSSLQTHACESSRPLLAALCGISAARSEPMRLLKAAFANGLLLAARWELVDHEISLVLERFRKSLGVLRGECIRGVVVKLDNHCLVIR